MNDKPKDTGNAVVDLFRDIENHVSKKNNLEKGDREAWGEWFSRLEFLGTMAGAFADKIEKDGC